MSDNNAIVFNAAVYKLSTLVDGGIRLTLDLPETAIPQMAMLAECKRSGIVLEVLCRAAKISPDYNAVLLQKMTDTFPDIKIGLTDA